jgi:hypothetical protein
MQRRQVGSKQRHFTNLAHSSTIDQSCGSGSGSGGIGIILADPDRQLGPAGPDPYPEPKSNQIQPNVILNYTLFQKIQYTVQNLENDDNFDTDEKDNVNWHCFE